ncbi:hypothetical protein [Roseovarius aestuariivivens]|uniref:hypothetical protein n=1 Tax=Roseovarius aestuariivivens TaxID=1888910 RepID=UPI0010804272|nr:hypothetical protein [Roseovarius aestuariivivens]
MAALARLVIVGFVVLTVIYISLSLYSRAVRRGKLETWWEEEGRPGDRDTYVREGLQDYDHSLRRKLILGVYVVPCLVVGVIIYFVNFH